MRLVVGLFAMFLTASVARADEAKGPEGSEAKAESTRAKVPVRLVKILADSRQVLLFDKTKGSHVLAEVGQSIDGYTVDDIDDDEVILVTATGKEVVLTLPVAAPEPVAAKKPAPTRAPAKPVAAPADPYAAPAGEAPVDPYAEPAVRSASAAPLPAILPPLGTELGAAPADPYPPAPARAKAAPATPEITVPDGPAKAAPDFVADALANDGVVVPAAPKAKPAVVAPAAVEEPEAAPAAVITPTVLSRSELNAALGDFTKLSSMLRGSFTKDGARLEAVAPSSVFAKAGLRAGDTVTAVDNMQIRSIDDAADLYVRAPQTRAANIQILRAGKPMTLRVLMQ